MTACLKAPKPAWSRSQISPLFDPFLSQERSAFIIAHPASCSRP